MNTSALLEEYLRQDWVQRRAELEWQAALGCKCYHVRRRGDNLAGFSSEETKLFRSFAPLRVGSVIDPCAPGGANRTEWRTFRVSLHWKRGEGKASDPIKQRP